MPYYTGDYYQGDYYQGDSAPKKRKKKRAGGVGRVLERARARGVARRGSVHPFAARMARARAAARRRRG